MASKNTENSIRLENAPDIDAVKQKLRSLADEKYRKFSAGLVKTDVEQKLRLIAGFIPKINNWAVCDSFSAGLVFVKKNKQRVWDFLITYSDSVKEFELRFISVMLMDYFIDEEHIDAVLKLFDGIRHEGYYVKMAVAWALSVCFVKFPEKTMEYLKNSSLDDFTYNKALQKIIESNRVDGNTKNLIRSMKRKNI
jgi:3-methyladenine DNA glycosylase AlkD